MKIKYIIIVLCGGILFLIAACGNKGVDQDKESNVSPPTNTITLTAQQLANIEPTYTELTSRVMQKTLRFNGKVDILPEYLTSVSHPLGGHVKSIKIVPGQRFVKGQVLAVLENYDVIGMQENLLMTQAKLETAELNYKRQRELNSAKANSDRVYEVAREEARTLGIALRSLEEKLRLAKIDPEKVSEHALTSSIDIRAPFDGMVSQINVHTGQYLNPSDVLFELVNSAGLIIHFKVFEKDLPSMRQKQEVVVYTNSHPEVPLKAEVMSINNYVNEDGSADVYAIFVDRSTPLALGMYLNAVVTVESQEAFALPESSVVAFEDRHYIFQKVEDASFRMVPVEVTATYGGYAALKNAEGILGAEIVNKGSYDLLMAMKNTNEEE